MIIPQVIIATFGMSHCSQTQISDNIITGICTNQYFLLIGLINNTTKESMMNKIACRHKSIILIFITSLIGKIIDRVDMILDNNGCIVLAKRR